MPTHGDTSWQGRRVLLGVSGGIAAYKVAHLVRLFKKRGADVQVLMTRGAERFISKLTLGTLSEREVYVDIFPGRSEQPTDETGHMTETGAASEEMASGEMGASHAAKATGSGGGWTKHIELGLWADIFIVAPATAQTIAKLAHGFSDNMLTATVLAARCPLLVCPAMDRDMYAHPSVEENLGRLRSFGHNVMDAPSGSLASGLEGPGRLPEPEDILARAANVIADSRRDAEKDTRGAAQGTGNARAAAAAQRARSDARNAPGNGKKAGPLAGKRVLVTAGPTREKIDPVRFISNSSTGTMGFALADAAARRGADVTLVAGPTALRTPEGVSRIDVTTAEQMHRAVHDRADADIVLMAAAVADYTPSAPSEQKTKKKKGDWKIRLKRTTDILGELGASRREGQVLVGFALETNDALKNARAKLDAKNLDWIVLNDASEEGAGFGPETNRVTLLSKDGSEESLPLMSKPEVASAIIEKILTTKHTVRD